ncbi:radical SAM protein [Desulfobotulus sp. H1]|uniref:Radical SAM protein n=1 Tax=Desulfobotulus pelophilus TaxID=2823377 RepID=A0ABT3NCZ2_9BACT|nr:radical SAM protein [Desulfobotulus pelophilus]MCW7755334.1 radical SAM protein [Desulfobotulus pelophilus]
MGGNFSDSVTLIVKVTRGCNLACRYCYVDKTCKQQNPLMDLGVLENIISKAQAACSRINYVWHGGEPLLAGMGYYPYISMLQSLYRRDSDQKVSNSIQTNGTLLSRQFIDILMSHGFEVGISYDANQREQSPSRPFVTGRATEPCVEQSIQRLQSVRSSAGVISVVTCENVGDAEGMLQRLSGLGISGVSFLPFKKTANSPDLGIRADQWTAFLMEVFDFWLRNDHTIKHIEPIGSMLQGLLGVPPSICTYKGPCFTRYLSIYPDGEVYPCSSLVGPEFYLGNIQEMSMEEIFNSSRMQDLRNRWRQAVHTRCSGCSYYSLCRGGCPEYAYYEQGRLMVSEDECHSRKIMFAYLARRLQELAPERLLACMDMPCSFVSEKEVSLQAG